MKVRVLNPNRACYPLYGGRGIQICVRWFIFDNFLADMGERPQGTTLDRINPNGNYEPSNCRWATNIEQGCTKRSNVWITYGGRTQTAVQWARELGVDGRVLASRFKRTQDVVKTIEMPYGKDVCEMRSGNCLQCGKAFQTVRLKTKFCGARCRGVYGYYDRRRKMQQ